MADPLIETKWNEWKSEVRGHFGRLTEEDWHRIEADKEALLTTLQQRYGYSHDEAKREVDSFIATRSRIVEAASEGVTGDAPTADDNGLRAQPGDVLGLDTDGETTSLGDTSADEDRRRVTALRSGSRSS
jgi:uncharacterized protein YjbJ (UPF0337 family)